MSLNIASEKMSAYIIIPLIYIFFCLIFLPFPKSSVFHLFWGAFRLYWNLVPANATLISSLLRPLSALRLTVVEHLLAKERVESSNLFIRFNFVLPLIYAFSFIVRFIFYFMRIPFRAFF